MEDEDYTASYLIFKNEILATLEPFLKERGFKYIGDTFRHNGNSYDNVKVYKNYISASKRFFGNTINCKYPIYFVFYNTSIYALAINTLYITNSMREVHIIKPQSYGYYTTPEDIMNAAEYVHRYLSNEEDARKMKTQLIDENKPYYIIYK